MGQFAVAAGVIGVGVIGLWLLGGKKSTTSKPDSMPKLNSGLRGRTMPITFGTNKVEAQITWSKNWNPVRQKSSGKGKGGGSGGFGSAKGGGSAGQNYIYYWDLMFHYGMFDVPSSPNRGWIGVDRIDPLAMDALTSGFSSNISSLIPISTLVEDESATLSYTEAFVGTALPTGDPGLSSWSYFQAQEGVDCAFPYTGWVGFNQYELGQSPTVPQLFMEWVPITASPSYESYGGFLSKTTKNSTSTATSDNAFVVDDDGKFYVVDHVSGFTVSEINGATQASKTSAELLTDMVSLGLASGSISMAATFPVGGKYFYTFGWATSGPAFWQYVVMYRVNTDGTISVEGGANYSGTFSAALAPFAGPAGAGLINTGEIVISFTDSSNLQAHAVVVHGPQSFTNGSIIIQGNLATRAVTIAGLGSSYFLGPGSNRTGVNTTLTSVIGNAIYYYFGKAEMDWVSVHGAGIGFNSYLQGIQPANPNGALVEVTLISDNAGTLSYTLVGPVAKFGVPYADVQLNSTGAAGTADDDYTAPVLSGSAAVFMSRRYSDNDYQVKTVYYQTGGTLIGHVTGIFSNSGNYLGVPQNIRVTFQSNKLLYIICTPLGVVGTVVATLAASVESALDVTPAYIIYRMLTHPAFGLATQAVFGFTVTEDRINALSYQAAVQECVDQGCYISVTYDQTGNFLDQVNDLLSLYSGYLTENDGIVSFGVVRNSDQPIRTLDNSHLVVERGKPPVKVSKAALEDGFNKVSLTYLDRALDYGQNQIVHSDEVDMDLNGPRPKDWNTRFVMPGSLANQIAVRALWSNLYGRDTFEFKTGWKDFDLRPGDLITLVDSYDAMLRGGVRTRLLKRSATDLPGSYKWLAVQDYTHINAASAAYSSIASISAGAGSVMEPATPPMWQTAYEVSREFQGAQAELYFAYGQASYVMGAQLHISRDGTNYLLSQDVQPYPITGVLAAPLAAKQKGSVEEKVDFYIFPTSTFLTSSPTYVQTYALDDVTAAIRQAGGGVLIVGSEAMSIQNLTLLEQNKYRAGRVFRGWGGTPVAAHSSGDYFHAHGSGIFAHEITQDDIGTALSYKIAPYNFAGKIVDVTSIEAGSYMIRGDYWLPRAQPVTRLWVNSAISWPASRQLNGPYIGVTSGGCDLIATWPLADNAEGLGAGGFGAGAFGHFIMSDSVAWRVDVYSSNAVPVSSFVVNTGYFNYTVAQNSADFNGFGRNLVMRVTPYTVKGDGPVTDAFSISLNW